MKSRRQVKPMVFISAAREGETRTFNNIRHNVLKNSIKFDYIDCVGVYKGTQERSLGVVLETHKLSHMIEWAKHFNQESILYRDELGECFLLYIDKGPYGIERNEYVGHWTKISKEVADKSDNYTYANVQGEHAYYTTVA